MADTTNKILLAVQKRKKVNPSVSAKGISLASWHVAAYLNQLQRAAGSKTKLKQYEQVHKLHNDWDLILKKAESKLIYQDDDCGVTKGIHANGEKFGEYDSEITPKSALDFDCILTTKSRDRDGDVLEPTGANIDRKMSLLLHHLPTEPVGKFVKLVSQDDTGVVIKNAIVNTPLGHDTAIKVEFGCFRVSHGFEPKEYEPLSLASSAYKDSALSAILSDEGDAGWHVKQYDVMEVSLVTIPSNPDSEILRTVEAKGKWHHPYNKLLGSKLLEDRPAVVTSGWEGEKNVINVHINNGPALMTKTATKAEEIEAEEEVPEDDPSEESEGDVSEDETVIEQKDATLGGGLLDDIDADIKNFGKNKKLPQEAKDRVNMIRNMIAGIKQKLNGHGEGIAKALKEQNVAGIGDIHTEMCSTLTNGLKRICREMDQLSSVEELEEPQRQELMEMQSSATAAHDMFKSYYSGKDSATDGDATEDEEDMEGMETKTPVNKEGQVLLQEFDANGNYNEGFVVQWDNGQIDGPFATEQEAQEHLKNPPAIPFADSKSYSVQEQGGQWYVVDDEGQQWGPYASENEANMNLFELESQAINYASHEVTGKMARKAGTVIGDGPWQIRWEDGTVGDEMYYDYDAAVADANAAFASDAGFEQEEDVSNLPFADSVDKDITEQPMLYDANTNQPLRPAKPEEIEACQQSGSGLIDVGGTLCYVKNFELSADDVALKLIGLLNVGKGHELRPEIGEMLKGHLLLKGPDKVNQLIGWLQAIEQYAELDEYTDDEAAMQNREVADEARRALRTGELTQEEYDQVAGASLDTSAF